MATDAFPEGVQLTCQIPVELDERLRDVAHWEEHRWTKNYIVTVAVMRYLQRLELERGSPYPSRPDSLRRNKRGPQKKSSSQ